MPLPLKRLCHSSKGFVSNEQSRVRSFSCFAYLLLFFSYSLICRLYHSLCWFLTTWTKLKEFYSENAVVVLQLELEFFTAAARYYLIKLLWWQPAKGFAGLKHFVTDWAIVMTNSRETNKWKPSFLLLFALCWIFSGLFFFLFLLKGDRPWNDVSIAKVQFLEWNL